jgi:hypothetical protein
MESTHLESPELRVPDTFQLSAISPVRAFCALSVFCKLQILKGADFFRPPPPKFSRKDNLFQNKHRWIRSGREAGQ